MRRNHARVARMELISPPVARELRGDLVDAFGHNQYRPVDGLRQKVPHRAIETSRQHDALPILCNEGIGAIDTEHRPDVTGEQPASCFGPVNRPKSLGLFWNQADDAGNRQLLVHKKKYFLSQTAA